METLEQLRSKIESAEGLGSVVRTMKGLAAVSIRQYERAVESLQEYFRTVELGMQAVLRERGEAVRLHEARGDGGDVTAAILFGSDQGMVGQFNSRMTDYALAELGRAGIGPPRRQMIVVGRRLTAALAAAGHEVAETFSLPNCVAAITTQVQQLLLRLQTYLRQNVSRVVLFYHHPLAGAVYEPSTWQVLPLDPEWIEKLRAGRWPTRMLPAYSMDWQVLLASLIRQYLFVSLYRAFAESLAAENASRMASMQAAEKNIEDRLERLRMLFYRQRQSSITEELLDVMAGFEALQE